MASISAPLAFGTHPQDTKERGSYPRPFTTLGKRDRAGFLFCVYSAVVQLNDRGERKDKDQKYALVCAHFLLAGLEIHVEDGVHRQVHEKDVHGKTCGVGRTERRRDLFGVRVDGSGEVRMAGWGGRRIGGNGLGMGRLGSCG